MFWLKAWRAGQDTPLLFPSAAIAKIAPDVFQAELGKKFPGESRDITQDNVLRALRISEPETMENFWKSLSNSTVFMDRTGLFTQSRTFCGKSSQEKTRGIVKPEVWSWECSGMGFSEGFAA